MLEIILDFITFILNSFLGLFIFYRNTKSWTNRLFLLLTFLIDVYVIVNYISLHPLVATPENQLLWIRVVMYVTSFIGPTLVLLVHTFPGDKLTMKKGYIAFFAFLATISSVASLSPYVFSAITYPNGKPVPIPGPAIPLFFCDFVGLFVFSFGLLIAKFRKSYGLIRVQTLYFLLGIIATFTLMAVVSVVSVVILKISDLVFLAPISILFLVGFIAYAIDKHRFLDAKIVVVRTVTFAIALFIISGIYSGMVVVLGTALFDVRFSLQAIMLSAALTMFTVSTFQPLQKLLTRITDNLLYKNTYNYEKLLKMLSEVINTHIDLQLLTSSTLDVLVHDMRISQAVFILFEQGKEKIAYIESKGYDKKPTFTEEQISALYGYGRLLVFDELEEGNLKHILRELDISIVMSLNLQKDKLGLLCLGQKSSGDIYSDRDLNVFEIITPELAVAIHNAYEYEQIKRFNITLKEEVDKATLDLRNANMKLKALDKLKDEFVSLASHELRTPMTAIKSYLWMAISGRGGEVSEKQKFYLDRAYKSTDRLINLVNDMLNVSRIESGRIIIDLQPVQMAELIEDVYADLSVRAKELGVNFKTQLPKALPLVMADQNKIKEVLINLVGNSFKFTPKGGTITVTAEQKGSDISIAVSDTGIGIRPEDLPRLFQKFGLISENYLQVQNAQGTGLGLYISKAIIELHKGKITVASEGRDKGTTFTFTIPVATNPSSTLPPAASSETAPVPPPSETLSTSDTTSSSSPAGEEQVPQTQEPAVKSQE